MPLTQIAMRKGKPESYRQAILDSISTALNDTFDVPQDNQFMTITEFDPANFRISRTYLGIDRSEDLVMIQITANNTRSTQQKKVLYQRIADCLGVNPGVRAEDVFVNLVEVSKDNWSLGLGLAQYA